MRGGKVAWVIVPAKYSYLYLPHHPSLSSPPPFSFFNFNIMPPISKLTPPLHFYIYIFLSSLHLQTLFHLLQIKLSFIFFKSNSLSSSSNQTHQFPQIHSYSNLNSLFSLFLFFINHHEAVDSPTFSRCRFLSVLSSPLRLSHQAPPILYSPFLHRAARPRSRLRWQRDGTVRRERSTPKPPCFRRAPR